jgi:signal transduction histidine kinase
VTSVGFSSPNGVGDGSSAWLGTSEMAGRVIARDWSASALGPLADWPPSLKSALSLCLHSPAPIAIYWGPEQICLFNDAAGAAGILYLSALGRPAGEAPADSWGIVGPRLGAVIQSGEATWSEDEPVVVERDGWPEVAYFRHSFSPILDDRAQVAGVLVVSHETTARVVAQRRLELLRDLGAQLLETGEALDACTIAVETLRGQADLEFALVYLTSDDGRRAACAASSGRSGEPEPVARELRLDGPGSVELAFGALAEHPVGARVLLSDLLVRARAAGSVTPGRALVVPIHPRAEAPVVGFLVLGCDRALLADERLTRFAETVAIGIGRSVAAVRERERTRSLMAADQDKARLLTDATYELQDLLSVLRAARRRAVVAGDAERQRIERNLHDGAQQRLMAVRLELTLLQETLEGDPRGARGELQRLRGELDAALRELRELAHGLYPQLLATHGLSDAVRAAARRATFPVAVEIGEFGRLPSVIESAAYFCCVEALQNVAKHAGSGAEATVSLSVREDTLYFRVSDDGVGFDTAASGGQGLTNLLDRVGALGGRGEIDATPGVGTTVTGWIPLVGLEDRPPPW